MKKIGIDARLYFQTGVGVYLRNFLHFLEQYAPANIQFYIYILRDDAPRIHFSNKQFIIRQVNSKWHTISEQLEFYRVLMADTLDLMHFTYFSYPVLYSRKYIATVHDLTPRLFKTGKASTKNPLIFNIKHRVFKFVLTSQVHNAVKVITPTQAVKNQLLEIYGTKIDHKVIPIYEGVDYELINTPENTELVHRFPESFFLYVGNFYPHKNVESLVEAFSDIQDPTPLILVGPNNYFSERIKYTTKKKEIKNVFMFHNAKTADLVYFYNHAKALINPSLSEGFGLPLLEAAHFGLPIIASDLPVFHELLGDQFTAFDPRNKEDMKKKIMTFLEYSNIRGQIDYSSVLAKYSFEKMTKEIIKIYASTT